MRNFIFGRTSRRNLQDVRPELVMLCERTLDLTSIDFGIVRGKGTLDHQRKLVQDGKSQTLKSLHLVGHAIDFAPYVLGTYVTQWPYYYPIADAFFHAAREMEIDIEWGGAWGIDPWKVRTAQTAQEIYIIQRLRTRRRPFLDGGHIELSEHSYKPNFSGIAFQRAA